jgi:hypothetical protein
MRSKICKGRSKGSSIQDSHRREHTDSSTSICDRDENRKGNRVGLVQEEERLNLTHPESGPIAVYRAGCAVIGASRWLAK